MNRSTIRQLSELSRIQMAAEAKLSTLRPDQPTQRELAIALKNGNRWASRFTDVDADRFSEDWKILGHRENSRSGFSGSGFQHRHSHDTVISLRSTEFIDGAVRDNLATNALEIRKTGFAWGQLADLQRCLYSSRSPLGTL